MLIFAVRVSNNAPKIYMVKVEILLWHYCDVILFCISQASGLAEMFTDLTLCELVPWQPVGRAIQR